MKLVALVTTGLVVALAASTLSAASGHQVPGETDRVPGGITDHRLEDPKRREGRIFAFYTTTSIKRLATTTITAVSTCLSILANAPACNGRKKRAMFTTLQSLKALGMNLPPDLEASQSEASGSPHREARGVEDREGRKLTVWSSVISTLTLTSTSYLAGTTISATALCTANGVDTNSCFG